MSHFIFQSMPTDMCALQDFDESDKLQIQVNDVITIIEGRWVLMCALNLNSLVRLLPKLAAVE